MPLLLGVFVLDGSFYKIFNIIRTGMQKAYTDLILLMLILR